MFGFMLQYFSYIVVFSFNGEGKWCTLTNFIACCIEYTSPWMEFARTALVVIGIDCTGSCKSNYHTITSTTNPMRYDELFRKKNLFEIYNVRIYNLKCCHVIKDTQSAISTFKSLQELASEWVPNRIAMLICLSYLCLREIDFSLYKSSFLYDVKIQDSRFNILYFS